MAEDLVKNTGNEMQEKNGETEEGEERKEKIRKENQHGRYERERVRERE